MRNIFYQANFCAECGNELEQRPGWLPRYFCDDCAARRRRRGYFTPLSLLLGLLLIAYLFNERSPAPPVDHANMIAAPPAVSALDATPNLKLLPPPAVQERVMCGARTKKGTPCRRLVPPGQ
ncbi:MAG: hypothetical protein J2P41_21975, partial [Blastocatellia bacterium]|nr:hypothetical protein [Blastocatellia bacterium]